MDHSTLQPRSRTSRRARPSLAAFTDSGYEPSRPTPATYPKKIKLHRNRNAQSVVGVPEDAPPPHSEAPEQQQQQQQSSSFFAEMFGTESYRASTYRGSRSHTMRHKRSTYPFTLDGEGGAGGGGTISGGGGGGTIRLEGGTGTIRLDGASKSGSSGYHRSNTMSRSATISSAWSGVSNRLFMESILGTSTERDANEFTYQFDRLAKKHGVQPFPHDFNEDPKSVSVSSASHNFSSSGESTPSTIRGSRLWNKLLGRTPNTVDVSKQHGNIKMTLTKRRNVDVSDLAAIGRGKRDSLKGMHLEDMIRLGGVAIFNLPLGLAPGDLLIPTCIHAAASFLLNNGLRTPGIFRVSGNLTTVYSLYDHYQRQLEENNNGAVVATTALARLPNINYSIHDVAHLFRKLLHGLPGGLLGSPAVFQALYNVHRFVYPDPALSDHMTQKVKPRMIALALSSINLHFRISLICAVFGLLRAVTLASEQEVETKVKDPHELFAQMREDALGIVFGPLLLGDKSDHILAEDLEDRGGLLVLASVDTVSRSGLRYGKSKKAETGYNKKQLEKTRRAAMVCQMLIDHWEDIAYQMKRINTLGATAQAYDLPASVKAQSEFKYLYEESPKKASIRGGNGEYVAKSERGMLRSSTRRSQRSQREAVVEEPEEEYRYPFQPHYHGARKPMPSFNGHFYPEPDLEEEDVPNLIVFPSDGEEEEEREVEVSGPFIAERLTPSPFVVEQTVSSIYPAEIARETTKSPYGTERRKSPSPFGTIGREAPVNRDTTKSPYGTERRKSPSPYGTIGREPPVNREITPVFEVTPIRALKPPTPPQCPETSPNWRVITGDTGSMPSTPVPQYEASWGSEFGRSPEPNWEPARQTSSQTTEPNWRQTSSQTTEPNWRQVSSQISEPNWQAEATPDQSPEQFVDPNKEQRYLDQAAMDQASQRLRDVAMGPPRFRDILDEDNQPRNTSDGAVSQASADRSLSLGSRGPIETFGPGTPPMDMTPQAAIRPRHNPLSRAFEEPSPTPSVSGRGVDTVEPIDRRSTFGRRPISPVPELSPTQATAPADEHDNEHENDHHDDDGSDSDRPITPRPLSFRKRSRTSSFSIFEDPERTPKDEGFRFPATQPALSLTKPNSRGELKLSVKGKRAVPLQPAAPNRRPRDVSMEEAAIGSGERGNSALYAEIRRLQRLVDQKNEEAVQTRRELELAKSMANAGTLSQLVRETQEQLKVWKNRAEWAEKQLRERRAGGSWRGHQTRASMG